MLEFLAGEADYVSAVTGLLFALASLAVLSLRQLRLQGLPWGWLASYLGVQALEALADLLLGAILEQDYVVVAARLFMRAVSNVLLLEYGRQSLSRLGFRVPGPWVLFVPVAVVGSGAVGGLAYLDACVFLLMGTPAKVLTGLVLIRVARNEVQFGGWLGLAGWMMLLLVLPSAARVLATLFLPEIRLTPEWVPASRSIPVDMAKCALAVVLDYSLWAFARKVRVSRLPDPSFDGFRSGARLALVALIGIMGMGWLVTFSLGTLARQEKIQQVVHLASASAATFSAELFRGLAGSVSDKETPRWKEIQRHCQSIADSVPDIRYVYSFGRRPGQESLFFFVDTEPSFVPVEERVEPCATPGDLYDDPAAELFSEVYDTGSPVSLGPYHDKWGAFISAGAPITDAQGQVVAILGIDVNARNWARTVAMQRLAPILLTLALAFMVAVLFSGYQRRLEDERRLAFSESSLRTVFGHVYEAIIVHDARGQVIDVNRRMLELWGISREQALAATLPGELVRPEGAAASLPKIWENVMAGEEVLLEWVCRRPTLGGEFPGEVFMTRMDRFDGPVVVSTVRDMTRRRVAEEQLRLAMSRAEALAERAEQANRAKSAFLANMSHEIRTPLNGVLGMTHLLLNSEISPQAREYVEIANRSGEHLLQVLNDILDFSKIEAGKLTVDQVPFDLAATVEDAAAALGVKILSAGLSFACIIRPGVPESVQGDPIRIRQILGNLIGNAAKFTQSGEIVVEVSRINDSPEPVAAIRIAVRDTGPGIPSDFVESLFRPFSQVDSALVKSAGGTGLGLSVCKRLVELMGGSIGVESALGRGSEFWFELPLRVVAVQSTSVPTLRMPADAAVLVVVPHAATLEMVRCQLQAMGAEFRAVASITDGMHHVRMLVAEGRSVAALVLDKELPGEAVASLVQAEGLGLKGVPVILLTRPSDTGSADGNSGRHQLLSKPVRRNQLARALANAMDGALPKAAGHGAWAEALAVPRQGQRLAILVVEDNQANQRVAQGLLGHLGHVVTLADNGVDALRKLANERFDLVLMDCQMPVMDGYEATRRIRFGPDAVTDRHVPVVAMTAHAFREERERCLASGMDDHLAKPVRLEELERVVKKWAGPKVAITTPRPRIITANERVFDREELEERLMADWRLIRKVAEACLREIPEHIEGLRMALEQRSQEQATLHTHSIKGVASTLSGQKLRCLALQAEKCAKEGQLDAVAELLPKIELAYNELNGVVDNFLKRLQV